MGQLLAIQPASPSSMLAHIAVIGRDCRGILDLPLAAPAHQDQREHPQGRLGVQISPARYHVRIQIASGCTLVSVLLHGPTSYAALAPTALLDLGTFPLRYDDVHVCVWFATLTHERGRRARHVERQLQPAAHSVHAAYGQ